MTAFYQLADGRLMSLSRRINVGLRDWMLVGWAEGDPYPHYVMERDARPMPGAPMPRIRLVGEGE